ncbi:hypothetical protein I4U23_009638 [Adineta vaga]|nr:hypothetical protein I4U23_009638 [Adineta vaga]
MRLFSIFSLIILLLSFLIINGEHRYRFTAPKGECQEKCKKGCVSNCRKSLESAGRNVDKECEENKPSTTVMGTTCICECPFNEFL